MPAGVVAPTVAPTATFSQQSVETGAPRGTEIGVASTLRAEAIGEKPANVGAGGTGAANVAETTKAARRSANIGTGVMDAGDAPLDGVGLIK